MTMLEEPISIRFWRCVEDERKSEGIKAESLPSPEYSFFFDDELLAQYQEHQKDYYDIHVMMGGVITSSCFVLARCNLMHSFEDGTCFIIAFFVNIFSYFLFTGLVLCFLAKHCSFDEKGVIAKVSRFILNSPSLINLLRDLMAISGTIGLSFGLLGRIVNGQCIENVTLWEAQRCNPAAATFGLPLDHVIFLMLSPALIQAMITGITYRGALICWCISTAALVACTIFVNGRLELWTFLSCFSVFVLMYRYEKLGRIKFLNSKSTAAAEVEKREYILLQQDAEHNLQSEKIKHEAEISNLQSQEECRLMEKEQLQMVAMIGNIAHDLKTPLQSFLMDLESLKGDEGFIKCKNRIESLILLYL